MASVILNDLPDGASLQRVTTALWEGKEPRGAALMVGAGLSRCATRVSEDAPLAPLWKDFSAEMEARIYPNGGAPEDPLRLAQEFEASLGRSALNELIRTKVNDAALLPGPLHKRLVALPWTDILTTNWDTLLERAASDNPDTFYSVVNNVDDIARTRSPRIVKLHGSLPSHLPFIFTEEDFRRYPRQFAPFVNLAQQVVMENALCLVGFSGDDPNFLQWTGWVRDHLGANAPDVFLVGALGLSPAKRKMLEARRVRPIDFSPILGSVAAHERHQRALSIFMEALQDAKPWPRHRWPEPAKGKTRKSEEKKIKLAEIWEEERAAYPGWVAAPWNARMFLRDVGHDWREYAPAFGKLDEAHKRRALYEFGWRLDTQLVPLPTVLLQDFAAAAEVDAAALPLSMRLDIARWLLREAREQGDEEAFQRWDNYLEQTDDRSTKAWLAWERCLRARDELDLAALEKALPHLVGDDPIWLMRKAALLVVLGREREALSHAHEALRELRFRRARDRDSIWVASRLSWALFVCQAANRFGDFKMPDDALDQMDATRWPSSLTQAMCDPWEERRHVEDELAELMRGRDEAIDVRYQFDPGVATHYSHVPTGRPIDEPITARRFFDAIGVPTSIGYMNLIGQGLEKAIEIEGVEGYPQILRIATSRLREERLDEIMNRLAVVRLDQDVVERAAGRLMEALEERVERWTRVPAEEEHWRESQAWSGQASRIAEVLSRLSVRLPSAQVRKIVEVAFDLAKRNQPSEWTFYKPLAHLLERGLKSLPRAERADYILDAIELPLPGETARTLKEDDWPELIFQFGNPEVDRKKRARRWTRRIEELVESAAVGGTLARIRAITRLSQLHRWGALTPAEQEAFAAALWAKRKGTSGMPSDTGLHEHVVLTLPEPIQGLARATFERDVLELGENKLPSEEQLIAVFNLVRHLDHPPGFGMDRGTARLWLERMSSWRRIRPEEKVVNQDWPDFSVDRYDDAYGWALAGAVAPALQADDVTDEILESLFSSGAALTVVRALPALVRLKPELFERATDALRRAFARAEELAWQAAADAMWEWAKLDNIVDAPSDLYGEVASAVLSRNPRSLHSALTIANYLVRRGRFSDADLSKLEHGLTYLLTELDYGSKQAGQMRHLSLARLGSARLAGSLLFVGRTAPVLTRWLEAAKCDPLPEVRHYDQREQLSDD